MLDSSALIQYLTGTTLGQIVREYFESVQGGETAYVSHLTVAETFYVLCRLEGIETAKLKISQMILSKMIQPLDSINLAIETGKLKCGRTISLPDCGCMTAAKDTESHPVFAFREADLTREMSRSPFDVAPIFLEDM